MPEFVVKDSGVREEYGTGMVRDTQDGKARFSLMRPQGVPYDEQFLTRCAMHMTNGAKKYGLRNWEKAHTPEELERFEDSAERHMQMYLAGMTDEDHAAGVWFNLNAAETVRYKMRLVKEGKLNCGCEYCEATAPPKPKTIGHMGIDGLSISIPITGWSMEELAAERVVPYHGHSHNDIEQVHVDAASDYHREMAPHYHDGNAVMAHPPLGDIDPNNHTRR